MAQSKPDIISRLQREILPLQGFKTSFQSRKPIPVYPIDQAFPNAIFPTGAVHEFISKTSEDTAATTGFVLAIISQLMRSNGIALWISSSRSLFPPSLLIFGIQPDKVIFIDLERELDCLWAAEEALKCKGIAAVICETPNLSFTASRRFQLAVEQSGVTGFVLRHKPRSLTTTATIARWRISQLKSATDELMPGVGFPCWNIELLKARNGKPGAWQMKFVGGELKQIEPAILFENQQHIAHTTVVHEEQRKAG